MNPRRLIRAALMMVALPALAHAQSISSASSVCPYAYPNVGQTVLKTLLTPRLEWFRKKYNLTDVDPRHVRPLRDADDAAACQRLTAWVDANAPFGLGKSVGPCILQGGRILLHIIPRQTSEK